MMLLEKMADPSDEALYEKTKSEVDKIYDKPSAYRSMAYTRFYLKAYREKYGNDKNAYKGRKDRGDLEKWRREKWIDIRSFIETPKDPKACGNVQYDKDEYPLCMPIRKAKSYTEKELIALLNRKAELGKTRLVKEPYLRELGVTREKRIRVVAEPEKKEKKVEEKPIKEKPIKEKPVKEKPIKDEQIVEEVVVEKKPIKEKVPLPPITERPWYKRRLEELKKQRAEAREQRMEAKKVQMEKPKRAKREFPFTVPIARTLPSGQQVFDISFD